MASDPPHPGPDDDERASSDSAEVAEAKRRYARYQLEVVEGLGLCPYAAPARQAGRVRVEVSLDRDLDVAAARARVDELARDLAVEVGLLVFPRVTVDRATFAHFVSEVRQLDADLSAPAAVTMALAEFHPDAPLDRETAARLVPYLRRTPDPTIQVVRRSVLGELRKRESHGSGFLDLTKIDLETLLKAPPAPPPLHERIAQTNWQTVAEVGPDVVEALLGAIHRDRR